jgi:hypothetical protein
MTDIFLSYSEKDREKAQRVAEGLQALGWTVWWDRVIPAGEKWQTVIERALEEMRCMVVLWSAQSVGSNWVYEEAEEGRSRNKLVPVLIERVKPPAGFRSLQAADLVGWDGSIQAAAFRRLVTDIERRLGRAPVPIPGQKRPDHPEPHPSWLRYGVWSVIGTSVAAALVWYGTPWLSGREPTVVPAPPPPAPASAPSSPSTASSPAPTPPGGTPGPARDEARTRPPVTDPTKSRQSRCTDLLEREQAGSLSAADFQTLTKECR